MAGQFNYATPGEAVICRDFNHIKSTLEVLDVILGSSEKIFERNLSIKDPVIRYVSLVDKLYIFIDVFTTIAESWLKKDYLGNCTDERSQKDYLKIQQELDKYLSRLQIFNKNIGNEMSKLIEWIQDPKYSPDHPLGQMMLEATMKDFKTGIAEKKSDI